MSTEKQNLEIMRHSFSHVLAAAVKELWPAALLSIGPAIENGFYYDIDFGETKVSDEDLTKIEEQMRELIAKDLKFEKSEMAAKAAAAKEKKAGAIYKAELIEDLMRAGESEVSYYTIGEFTDLCAGPHVASTGKLNPDGFKLTKLAGAYWRGDEKNKMLTRIYGAAFASKTELEEHLKLIEEAEKRDHRKLGKELNLFMMHDFAPGMPFFLPKGMVILNELAAFVREYSYGAGYREVRTPQLLNSELWKISGHWEHYQEDMFCLHHAADNVDIGIKPMNCPAHMLVFKRDVHSYRELPLRLAETTTLYRNERSGTLHGLTRVRAISQDDTHIFLTEEQILPEILALLDKIKIIYQVFDLKIDEINLSTRPESFMGEKLFWDQAEANLKTALDQADLPYQINEGDGAFYGPKIDVKVKDTIGRQWQLATIQLDFQLPRRFDLTYAAIDGTEKTPVVIHRALLGSMERFLGILIEHYVGAFPVWLAPVQVKIISVGETHIDFCKKLAAEFSTEGIRAEVDSADETVGNKIRKAVNEKVPYMLVIGDKEIASPPSTSSGQAILAVRDRGSRETRQISKKMFIDEIKDKISQRR